MGLLNLKAGTLNRDVRQSNQTLTASGAIAPVGGLVALNHASVVIAATLTPIEGQTYIIWSPTTTAAHTVTLGGGFTWDGTATIATFGTTKVLTVYFTSNRAVIISNPGAVLFT